MPAPVNLKPILDAIEYSITQIGTQQPFVNQVEQQRAIMALEGVADIVRALCFQTDEEMPNWLGPRPQKP